MKTIKSIILISSVTSLLLSSEISIDAQIQMIRQASPTQRYKLVNQLKEQISRMNVAQQARSIAKYQKESLKIAQQATTANQLAIQERVRQHEVDKSIVPPIKQIPENKIKPIHTPTPDVSNLPDHDTPSKRPTPEQNLPQPPYHDGSTPEASKHIPTPSHEDMPEQNLPYHDGSIIPEASQHIPTPSHEEMPKNQVTEVPYHDSPSPDTPKPDYQKTEQKRSLPISNPSSTSRPTNGISHRGGF